MLFNVGFPCFSEFSFFPLASCTSYFPIAMQGMILINGATFLSTDMPELQHQSWLPSWSTSSVLSSRTKKRYRTIPALFASFMNLIQNLLHCVSVIIDHFYYPTKFYTTILLTDNLKLQSLIPSTQNGHHEVIWDRLLSRARARAIH